MIAAEIDPADLERMRKLMERAVHDLGMSTRDITRQAIVFAVQSAAKETGPGNASSPKKMAVQFRFRKIVPYKDSGMYSPSLQRNVKDFRYAYRTSSGETKMFPTDVEISKKSQNKRGLRELKRNIEIYDRKLRTMRMIPYIGTATGKYDKTSRVGRIPHAGAAKAGWLKALGRLPGSKPEALENPQYVPTPNVSVEKSKDTYAITVENIVKYITKISPNAAAIAIKKTANRMEKIYERKIKDKTGEVIF